MEKKLPEEIIVINQKLFQHSSDDKQLVEKNVNFTV